MVFFRGLFITYDIKIIAILLTILLSFQILLSLFTLFQTRKKLSPLELLRKRNSELEILLQSNELENELRYNMFLETVLAGKIDQLTDELKDLVEKGDSEIEQVFPEEKSKLISFRLTNFKKGAKYLSDKLFQKTLGVINSLLGLGSSKN